MTQWREKLEHHLWMCCKGHHLETNPVHVCMCLILVTALHKTALEHFKLILSATQYITNIWGVRKLFSTYWKQVENLKPCRNKYLDKSIDNLIVLLVGLFSPPSVVSLKSFESPSVKRRYIRSPEAARTTPQQPERRERGREQKENVGVHSRDVDTFALPAPRTPASSKKAARHNKNVLTTPNHNGAKTGAVSPRSKSAPLSIQSASMKECREMAALTWSYSLFVYYNWFTSLTHQGPWSTGISIWLFALASWPLAAQSPLIYLSHTRRCAAPHNHKCHIHMPHICK